MKVLELSWLKPESIKKGILYSIAMSLAAKGLSFLMQAAVVAYFGAEGTTDIFFWCLGLIFSLTGLISSVNGTVVVPHSIHLLNGQGRPAMQGFLASIGRIYLAAGIAVTLAAVCFPGEIARWLSKFDAQTIDGNLAIIRLTLLTLPAAIGSALLSDIFAIYKIFSVPIAVEAIKGGTTLAVFLALHSRLGGAGMGWAFLAGSIVQVLVLAAIMKSKLGWPTGAGRGHITKAVWGNIGYTLLGQSSFFIYVTYTAYLMSGFRSGIFSTMNCAQSLSNPIQLIFLTKISYVVGIYFMELYSQNRLKELNSLFLTWLKTVLLGLFILLPLLAYYSDRLVSLMFLRGNFQARDAVLTGDFFRLFIVSLPLVLVDNFVTQLVFAAKKVGSSVYLQLGGSAANALVITLLVKHFGYRGYPLGLLTVRFLYLFVQWAFVRKVFAFLDFRAVPAYLARNTLTLLAVAAALWPASRMNPVVFGALLPSAIFMGLLIWKDNRLIVARLLDHARRKFSGG